jgi:hypothetical protein
MGGCNIDIDRRHSIAIACPFVSRVAIGSCRYEKAGYKASGSLIIASFFYRISRLAPPHPGHVLVTISNQQVCSH